MTTPKVNTIKRGGARLYVHPDDGQKVPGVTSILNMLPKDFLKFWAAKAVATQAVDLLGEVVGIALRDRQAAIDMLKRAPDRDVAQAAQNGTDVHDMFERLAKGETLGRIHPDLEPYVGIFRGFEKQYDPEFLFLEQTVWSVKHGYAGSFDWCAKVTDPKTGERLTAMGDWKTTRSGVHEEVSLQLTAYANADYIVGADGAQIDIPQIDVGLVVHARPEGGQVVPALISDELFTEVFLPLMQIFQYEKETKKTVLGQGIPIEIVEEPKRRGRR
ncbi:hypothetical protein ACXJJ3_32710 [Kribbella sp. WER1]